MRPDHVNAIQWHQAVGYARQACARVFRDGGTPDQALELFGLPDAGGQAGWDRAVDAIAETLCHNQPEYRRAA